jgi:hypothetical protein
MHLSRKMNPRSASETGEIKTGPDNYIRVSARVRPLIAREQLCDQVLGVIEHKGQRLLRLETGTHYNMGQKFYLIKNVMDETCGQS